MLETQHTMQNILASKSCPILCNPIDCSPPGSSVHEDPPSKNTSLGCHALLQVIFPTQGSHHGLPHCRWILYHLSHQGSPSLSLQMPMLGLELCFYGLAHFCPQNYTQKSLTIHAWPNLFSNLELLGSSEQSTILTESYFKEFPLVCLSFV